MNNKPKLKSVKGYVLINKTKPAILDASMPIFWSKAVAESVNKDFNNNYTILECTITYTLK